mmetsp:Transcript_64670/g.107155  ORF Transcript_64670/g.107155 Transcript_64670/m.107155 type:complete len:246 (+) Transcript_64670:341-1078(+)
MMDTAVTGMPDRCRPTDDFQGLCAATHSHDSTQALSPSPDPEPPLGDDTRSSSERGAASGRGVRRNVWSGVHAGRSHSVAGFPRPSPTSPVTSARKDPDEGGPLPLGWPAQTPTRSDHGPSHRPPQASIVAMLSWDSLGEAGQCRFGNSGAGGSASPRVCRRYASFSSVIMVFIRVSFPMQWWTLALRYRVWSSRAMFADRMHSSPPYPWASSRCAMSVPRMFRSLPYARCWSRMAMCAPATAAA